MIWLAIAGVIAAFFLFFWLIERWGDRNYPER